MLRREVVPVQHLVERAVARARPGHAEREVVLVHALEALVEAARVERRARAPGAPHAGAAASESVSWQEPGKMYFWMKGSCSLEGAPQPMKCARPRPSGASTSRIEAKQRGCSRWARCSRPP